MKSKKQMLYELYLENPNITDAEAAAIIGAPQGTVRVTRNRLVKDGVIQYTDEGITVLEDITFRDDSPISFKVSILREMLDVYMDDFRACETFKDRLLVGQEVRAILKAI